MKKSILSEPPLFTRAEQHRRELTLATIRSETGNPDLRFRGEHLYQGHIFIPIAASHLQPHDFCDDIQALRGRADAISARLLLSDVNVHQSAMPVDPIARMLFDLLEQYRTEALYGQSHQLGVRENLRYRFDTWSQQVLHENLTESRLGILLFTVIQTVRSRLFSTPIDSEIENIIEATRAGIVSDIGAELSGLRRHTASQKNYASFALMLSEKISKMIKESEWNDGKDEKTQQRFNAFPLLLSTDIETDNSGASTHGENNSSFETNSRSYQVFNREFDTEIDACTLIRKAQLEAFRAYLDKRFNHLGLNVREMARRLLLCLSQPTRDGWQFDEEEGHIDGSRLTQVVSSPMERRVFVKERFINKPDCAVSILIDCSGSMRQHIENIIHLVDGLIRALGLGGVSTEVLGYTTNTWHGGRPYKQWLTTAQTPMPGRMNEICHLIFKDTATDWRQGSRHIAALMKGDIFREGIDGEAIEWACSRLQQSDTSKRILLVLSDGSPMDTATHLANGDTYLDNHLKQVITSREKRGDSIAAIGVGVDLSRFYPLSLTLDNDFHPDSTTFNDIIALISASVRKRPETKHH